MAAPGDPRPPRPALPGFVVGAPLFVGLILLCLGLPLAWQAWEFRSAGHRAEGVVTALRSETRCSGAGRDRRCTRVWRPTVRFSQPVTGETLEVETAQSLSSPRFRPGDRAPLRYLREQPRMVRIDDWRAVWAVPGALLGAAALAFAGGLALRRHARRHARPAAPTAPASTPPPRWVTAATLVFPAAMALSTGLLARDAAEFRAASRLTTGEVIEPATGPDARPLFRYRDHEGRLREGRPETSPWTDFAAAGVTSPIRHRLDDPAVFRATPSALSLWAPTLVLGLATAFFGGALIAALRFMATAP